MPDSVYIHIPFCKSKCRYCSFVSFTDESKKSAYIESLLNEIGVNYMGEPLKTLYFGGGTPSLIDAGSLKKIIDKFNFKDNCEITFELNPDDADIQYLKELKEIGINRLSMGAQSFNNRILNLIGRRHSAEDTKNAVRLAKEAGFFNISLDLIYGLPYQTMEDLLFDIKEILKLNIQHISTYGLKIEDGSYFGSHLPPNLPDEDTQADMYEGVNELLGENGFYRYEISNFSKKGYESRHNLNYWNNEEYYGFGTAAHGYIDGVRYYNYTNMDDYLIYENKKASEHKLSLKEKLEEEIFLGFRKEEGINVSKIKTKYNFDFEKTFAPVLNKYKDFIIKTPLGYKLNLQGVLLSNNILSEFLM